MGQKTPQSNVVDDKEHIVRFLLSPMHFNKSGGLRSNAFNPTPDTDEVSVSRLVVLPIDETKRVAKKMAAANASNEYAGFALHTKESAMDCGATDVIPEPTEENKAHAELKLGVMRKNNQIPAELQAIKDNLTLRCKVLRDPSPESEEWSGDEPLY